MPPSPAPPSTSPPKAVTITASGLDASLECGASNWQVALGSWTGDQFLVQKHRKFISRGYFFCILQKNLPYSEHWIYTLYSPKIVALKVYLYEWTGPIRMTEFYCICINAIWFTRCLCCVQGSRACWRKEAKNELNYVPQLYTNSIWTPLSLLWYYLPFQVPSIHTNSRKLIVKFSRILGSGL